MCFGLDGTDRSAAAAFRAERCVLPYPCGAGTEIRAPRACGRIGAEDVIALLPPGTPAAAGAPSAELTAALAGAGIPVFDYATERLLRKNAALTAEGLLGLAEAELPFALAGAPVLVVGAGRVGRAAALLLDRVGADVTVSAERSESFVWAAACGIRAVRTGAPGAAAGMRAVINTVPRPVVGAGTVAASRPDCVFFELAGAPGGVDPAACRALGRRLVPAPGLPGRFSPESAAAAILDELDTWMETEEKRVDV